MSLFALCGCAGVPGAGSGAPVAMPSGLSGVPGSGMDAATGLPRVCVHAASGVRFVLAPAGEFMMGDMREAGRSRAHRRVLAEAFYIGETEVTVAQFARFVEATGYVTDAERGVPEEPDKGVGAFAQIGVFHQRQWDARASWRDPFPRLGLVAGQDDPVSQVSWNDASAFCRHYGFELPTEAQWEYASRAGGEGDTGMEGRGNVADASTARFFGVGEGDGVNAFDDGFAVHAPVRSFRANAWGVYDMIGNLEEWTAEWFHIEPPVDGEGAWSRVSPAGGEARALRGSAWISGPGGNVHVDRFGMRPFSRRDFIGFRVCIQVRGLSGS